MRKGLGLGMGKGYKNLAYKDPMVHGLSAKGISQKNILNISGDIANTLNMSGDEEKGKNFWFKTYINKDNVRMDVDVKKKRILIADNDDVDGSLLKLDAKKEKISFMEAGEFEWDVSESTRKDMLKRLGYSHSDVKEYSKLEFDELPKDLQVRIVDNWSDYDIDDMEDDDE